MTFDVRPLLLWILLAGILGVSADLTLLGHTEDRFQWVPLVALAVGAILTLLNLTRPSTGKVRALGYVMAGFLAAAVAGLYFHLSANREFELEMYPSMSGLELVWESLTGATPALAPGSMALLGVIGCLYAFRHPVFENSTKS